MDEMVSPAASHMQPSTIAFNNSVHNVGERVLSCGSRSSACTWSRVGTVPAVSDISFGSQLREEGAWENEMVAEVLRDSVAICASVLLNQQSMHKHWLAAPQHVLVLLGGSAADPLY